MITTIVGAAVLGTSLALIGAAPALADIDSIVNVGDKNLGATVGTTGGSVSLGGVTTTVDGINTLHGSLEVSGYGYSSKVEQSYTLGGIETEWEVTTPSSTSRVEGYLYYDPSRWGALDIDAHGGSVSIVCDPLCRQQ